MKNFFNTLPFDSTGPKSGSDKFSIFKQPFTFTLANAKMNTCPAETQNTLSPTDTIFKTSLFELRQLAEENDYDPHLIELHYRIFVFLNGTTEITITDATRYWNEISTTCTFDPNFT